MTSLFNLFPEYTSTRVLYAPEIKGETQLTSTDDESSNKELIQAKVARRLKYVDQNGLLIGSGPTTKIRLEKNRSLFYEKLEQHPLLSERRPDKGSAIHYCNGRPTVHRKPKEIWQTSHRNGYQI